MGRRLLSVVVVGAAALTAASCASGKVGGPSSTSTTSTTAAAPTTTTTTTVAVDQIPPAITVEYAQRVMDALDKLEGDVTRLLVAKRVPTLQFKQMLTALYDEPAFDKAEASYGRDAADDLQVYTANPGNPVTLVKRVVDWSPTCVVLDVDRDFGPTLKEKPPADTLSGVVFLRPKKLERDALHANPTAWSITADGKPVPGAHVERACD